jgi:hypothetical protein
MKIAALNTRDAANRPRELVLRDAFSGEVLHGADGKPMRVWVYGDPSDKARNAKKEVMRKSGGSANLSEEDHERIGAEYLAEITQGWSDNWIDENGEAIPFTHENAVQVYLLNDGMADQVTKFSRNISNYDPKK